MSDGGGRLGVEVRREIARPEESRRMGRLCVNDSQLGLRARWVYCGGESGKSRVRMMCLRS